MTCFPRNKYNRKEIIMNKQDELKQIPYSIRSGLMPKSVVTFEGLSTKLDISRSKNDDLSNGLPIYKPVDEDDGLNFGVMLYEHDNFKDTYEVNPHKINFDKDRNTLCVGSTHYPANIGRFKKGTEEKNYTLKLDKNVRSPLFVPYDYAENTNIFLVLFPLDNEHDDPPLILDEDDVDDNARTESKKIVTKKDLSEDDIDQEDVVTEKPLEKPLAIHTVQTKEEFEYVDDIDFENREKLAEFKTAEFMKQNNKNKRRQQKSKPFRDDDDFNVVYEDDGLKMLFEPTSKQVDKEEYEPLQDINFS